MAWILTVACDACTFKQELLTGSGRRYSYCEGQHLPLFARLAWCEACRKVVEAEELPPLEDIQRELENSAVEEPFDLDAWHKAEVGQLWPAAGNELRSNKVRHGVLDVLDWPWKHVSRQEYLAVLACLIRWRRERRSGPRCLLCGSVKIHYLENAPAVEECSEMLAHPGCQGRLRAVCIGHASTSRCSDSFSPEGYLEGRHPSIC
jgi:hypothetical protein